MASPQVNDFVRVKKLVRALKGLFPVKWKFRMQSEEEATKIKVFVDSDWAGCRKTRRSTSGGLLLVGGHPLRTWSSTQPTIATSSGEAELISMAEGASRGLGMRSMMSELGCEPR